MGCSMFRDKNNLLLCGDTLEMLKKLPDNCIDCCVTSPPYYGLRDYGDSRQIGLEQTPNEYIEKLVVVFHELKRVLKFNGTLWLNIGDSYSGSNKGASNYPDSVKGTKQSTSKGILGAKNVTKTTFDKKRKELLMIPARLAIALSNDGWYLRQDIIWHKTNPMPESVKDRCTKAHEYIYLLSKSPNYYFNAEAIKEKATSNDKNIRDRDNIKLNNTLGRSKMNGLVHNNYETRNKRDVWTLSNKPYKGAHFATFPPELPEICLRAGCPENGIASDIFLGSGTTGKVANDLGLKFVGIELNKDYFETAKQRIGVIK